MIVCVCTCVWYSVYVSLCVCVYDCMCVYMCVSLCVCLCVYDCMCVYMCVSLCVCLCIYDCMCVYMCVSLCVCHGQARGQTQPVQTQTWVPMFMSFLQKLCQSRVHRAENMC